MNATPSHNGHDRFASPHSPPLSPANAPESGPPPAGNGRDTKGRFVKGNGGGPGNPFARQTAAFRKALCAAVTEDDIATITRVLLEKARAGDLAAIKLLLAYTVGRPTPAANPDTVELDDFDLAWRKVDQDSKLWASLDKAFPGARAVLREAMKPGLARRLCDSLTADLGAGDQPSVNGDNGACAPGGAPTANGENGGPERVAAPTPNGDNGAPGRAARRRRGRERGTGPLGIDPAALPSVEELLRGIPELFALGGDASETAGASSPESMGRKRKGNHFPGERG